MVSPEAVRACYRVLLGREPENENVVAQKAALGSYDQLFAEFLGCDEFLQKFPRFFRPFALQSGHAVEVAVSDPDLAAMFERIRQEWSKLGEEIPYWSVLTHDAYKTPVLDEAEARMFFATGEEAAESLFAFARRCGVTVPRGRCLEFGAGVGRVTTHLAPRFEDVFAVDISPGNLAICERTLRDRGQTNVTPLLLTSPQDVDRVPAFDVLFSTIVFQHNPPPVQRYLLDQLLARLRPGGVFLFQTPTHSPHYQFAAKDYLASPHEVLEMHDLPMPEVFRSISRSGAQVLEVLMDHWTGLYGSHTFFGVKPD